MGGWLRKLRDCYPLWLLFLPLLFVFMVFAAYLEELSLVLERRRRRRSRA